MGGMLDSAGGFLGLSSGPKVDVQSQNYGLGLQNRGLGIYDDPNLTNVMQNYGQGKTGLDDTLNYLKESGSGQDAAAHQQALNQLATGATTGSQFATDQVQNNSILGGLYGKGGQLGQASDQLSKLYNQGFELSPEDHTLYGQASGNIARQFGQAGNQTANDLASRGLSSSGAAGAAFSGLSGNKNEQLANAQQNIMQQRFQNTMSQIGQYQNFVNSMGSNANNAINSQYQRQMSGAQNQQNLTSGASQQQMMQNQGVNNANLQKGMFEQANKPVNGMDFYTAGMGQGLQSTGSMMAGGSDQQKGMAMQAASKGGGA